MEVANAARVVNANVRYQMGSLIATRFATKPKPTFKSLLGLSSDIDMKPVAETLDTVFGTSEQKFQQVYKGLQVVDGSVDAEVRVPDNYEGGTIGGSIILNIKKDIPNIDCEFSKTKAIDMVLSAEGLDQSNMIGAVVTPLKIITDKEHKARLTIIVEMLAKSSEGRIQPCYYIDMCTGEIFRKFNKVKRRTTSSTTNTDTTESSTTETTYSLTGYTSTSEVPTEGSTQATTTSATEGPTQAPTTSATKGPTQAPTTSATKGPTQAPTTSATKGPTQAPTTPTIPESCGTAVGVGGNAKTGKYNYGESPRCMSIVQNGLTCSMENDYVLTVDLKQTEDESKRDVITFPCSSGYTDEVNDGYGPANDAFFFATITQRMLNEWYKVNPLKKQTVLVHYGNKMENAFYFNSAIMLGDGDSYFYPLTNLDTIAHEMGHGVTALYSNLVYDEQSGGINEAFSDIMGEAAEEFFTDTDWLSGFEDMKHPTKPLRYFDKPSRDGSSIDHASDYYSGIDVHLSSGVYNRAFYLICNEFGIDLQYAFEALLTANRVYWTENSDYSNAACGVLKAAYGHGLDVEGFRSAFTKVGVSTCDPSTFLKTLPLDNGGQNLKISSIRQPLLGVELQASDTSITITTTGGNGIKVAVTSSLSRSSTLVTGDGSVTWATGGKTGLVYVRLYTDNNTEQTNVSVSLTKS